VEASNSCAGTLIFGSFFFIVFCQRFFPFFRPFSLFLLSVLLSFLLLSNWFLFLSSFVFPLLFRHCFIPISLAHVVSSLAYPNLLGTKRLGCCVFLLLSLTLPLFFRVYVFILVIIVTGSAKTRSALLILCKIRGAAVGGGDGMSSGRVDRSSYPLLFLKTLLLLVRK
jgi:hypothetical protein